MMMMMMICNCEISFLYTCDNRFVIANASFKSYAMYSDTLYIH
jgi:hypothetical protein